MRTLTPSAATALASGAVALVQLVEMLLTNPLRLNSSGWDLTWNGAAWQGSRGIGSIEPIEDSPGELRGLRFEMPGIALSDVALVLSEPVQGKTVNVWTAIVDASTAQILDASLEWSGRLDTLALAEDGERATVSATAEHIGLDLLRPSGVKFSHQDQQRRYPGDRFFEYLIDQADQQITWPSAQFFKQ